MYQCLKNILFKLFKPFIAPIRHQKNSLMSILLLLEYFLFADCYLLISLYQLWIFIPIIPIVTYKFCLINNQEEIVVLMGLSLLYHQQCSCGKTFILQPLCVMYKCFLNPASTTFAWVGAETAEVILLNDFRWSKQIIPWHDLLQMLEGQPVHLSAPKTHYAKDLVLDKDTPIFCTSSTRIRYVSQGAINERETEMMEVRWKVFSFYKQIPEGRQREITPCGTCFAHLILDD